MTLFEEIVNRRLLNEIAESEEQRIIDAINKVLRVRIRYNDKDTRYVKSYNGAPVGPSKGKNERYILPVAYGYTKTGKKAVRAYQTTGSTRRGKPHWKLFLLDNIFSWSNGTRSFKEYKDALINRGLNLQGDKSMTEIIAITPFANDNVQVAKNPLPIKSEPLTKADVAPTEKLQNPNTTDTSINTSAQFKRNPSIDNTNNNSYFSNKMTAPETQPVTQTDIDGVKNNDNVDLSTTSATPEKTSFTGPVSKSDIQTGDEKQDLKDNPLTKSYNDMLNRIDNLGKDDTENIEKEDNEEKEI